MYMLFSAASSPDSTKTHSSLDYPCTTHWRTGRGKEEEGRERERERESNRMINGADRQVQYVCRHITCTVTVLGTLHVLYMYSCACGLTL